MSNQSKVVEHPCQNCGEPIPKKTYESVNRHKSRKYCSQKCSREYMKKNKVGWFKSGAQTIKRDIWKQRCPSHLP